MFLSYKFRNTSKFKYLSVVFSATLILALLTGCKFMTADNGDHFSKIASPVTGFYAEQFIPQDMTFVGALDFHESSQNESFDKLRALFVSDREWTEALEDLSAQFEDGEKMFDFRAQVLDVFGDDFRVAGAADKELFESILSGNYLYPGEEGYPYKEEDELYGLAYKQPLKGNWYLIVKIADTDKFNSLMQLFAEEEVFVKMTENGMESWWNEADAVYMARHQDQLVVSNSSGNLKSAIDMAKSGSDSIKDDKDFKKVFANLSYPHFAYAYIDMQDYRSFYKETLAELDPAISQSMGTFYDKFMRGTGSGFAMVLEDDGLRLKSYSFIDESTLKPEDKGFEILGGELHLLNKMPAKGLAVYEEVGGLGTILKDALDLAQSAADGVSTQSVNISSQFKAVTGLDLEKDILAFLDKNFAFYLGDSGSLIPNFGFWIDASSAPDAALRTLDVLDSTLLVGIMGIKSTMTAEQATLIVKDKVNLEGGDVHRIVLDFTSLSEQDKALFDLPEVLKNEKFEFYYGLTGNDIFVFSLHSGLDKFYGKETLNKAGFYKNAVKDLSVKADDAVAYIDTARVLEYVDRMFDNLSAQEFISESDRQDYDEVKKYLSPIKSFVMVNDVSRTEQLGEGFLTLK